MIGYEVEIIYKSGKNQPQMVSESNLRKILDLLNFNVNLDKYTELLELFDQIVDLEGDDEDFFLVPEESNLQLPEIFLKDTHIAEYDDFVRQNSTVKQTEKFEENCFEILEYLETVELEEYIPPKRKTPTELDTTILKNMVKMYF